MPIKYKILIPLLLVSIPFSIIIFVFFNVSLQWYTKTHIQNEFSRTVNTIVDTYHKETENTSFSSEEKYKQFIDITSHEINNHKLMSSMHFTIVNPQLTSIYPKSNNMSSLSFAVLQAFYTTIQNDLTNQLHKSISFNVQKTKYYAYVVETTIYENDYVVFYLAEYMTDAFMTPMNRTLLFILSITTLSFILVAFLVVKSISASIAQVSATAMDIKESHYEPVVIKNPSLEVAY